jgi:uncharacterized protein YceK
MKQLILVLSTLILLVGCSSIPSNPAVSFGKKCEVGADGTTVVSSHVWVYDKTRGLTASEESCNNIDNKK